MPADITDQTTFMPGVKSTLESASPVVSAVGVVFEDDGVTGYFYACDFTKNENPVVDALHVYNAAAVTDKHFESVAQVVWSEDGLKAALLINRYTHAIFDFEAKRGYCRRNFPPPNARWTQHGHEWDDAAQELFI